MIAVNTYILIAIDQPVPMITKNSRLLLRRAAFKMLHDQSHGMVLYRVMAFIEDEQIYVFNFYV